MRLVKSYLEKIRAESGSASLEFITAGLILLVPMVYLAVAMANIQGAALAVEGAARQAARVYATSPTEQIASARVEHAVTVALSDYGVDTGTSKVTVQCQPNPNKCLSPDGTVRVTVRVEATLPLVPSVLNLSHAANVPLEASALQNISRWRGAP